MRDPGQRAESGIPRGIQCGVQGLVRGPVSHAGCSVGSVIAYMGPPVRADPDRQCPTRLGKASHETLMVPELCDEPAVRSRESYNIWNSQPCYFDKLPWDLHTPIHALGMLAMSLERDLEVPLDIGPEARDQQSQSGSSTDGMTPGPSLSESHIMWEKIQEEKCLGLVTKPIGVAIDAWGGWDKFHQAVTAGIVWAHPNCKPDRINPSHYQWRAGSTVPVGSMPGTKRNFDMRSYLMTIEMLKEVGFDIDPKVNEILAWQAASVAENIPPPVREALFNVQKLCDQSCDNAWINYRRLRTPESAISMAVADTLKSRCEASLRLCMKSGIKQGTKHVLEQGIKHCIKQELGEGPYRGDQPGKHTGDQPGGPPGDQAGHQTGSQPGNSPGVRRSMRVPVRDPCGVRCGTSDFSGGVPSPVRGSMREP